jgi:hypothetical protein
MMKKIYSMVLVIVIVMSSSVCTASVGVSAGVRALVKTVAEYLGRVEAREFARAGGEMALKEVLENAEKRGGRELAERVAALTRQYGSRTMRALSREPEIMVPAIEKLPVSLGRRAVDVINRSPETAVALVKRYGDDAVEVLARHRGTGEFIIEKFGDDGIRLGKALPEEMGIKLLQESKEIMKLPPTKKKKFIRTLIRIPDKIASFIESHPKATLLVAAAFYVPELGEVIVSETGNVANHLVDSVIGGKRSTTKYKTPDGKVIEETSVEGLMGMKRLGIIGYVVAALLAVIGLYFIVKTFMIFRRKRA